MQKRELLVIEDDWSIRETLESLFLDEGYPVRSAENGRDALKQLEAASQNQETLPSLIILDLNMPFMNGEEFLAAQKSHPRLKQIPVAVFTAAGGKAKPELAEDFIPKPINLDSLLTLVEKYCSEA